MSLPGGRIQSTVFMFRMAITAKIAAFVCPSPPRIGFSSFLLVSLELCSFVSLVSAVASAPCWLVDGRTDILMPLLELILSRAAKFQRFLQSWKHCIQVIVKRGIVLKPLSSSSMLTYFIYLFIFHQNATRDKGHANWLRRHVHVISAPAW